MMQEQSQDKNNLEKEEKYIFSNNCKFTLKDKKSNRITQIKFFFFLFYNFFFFT